MPIYTHECENETCKYSWDDLFDLHDPNPECCPKCGSKKLHRINVYAPAGKVELYGMELYSKLREDGAKIKKQANSSEKVYANLLGENRYQQLQTSMDSAKKEGFDG